MNRTLDVAWLGRLPYGEALALQRHLAGERIAGRIQDRLLLLEHPPVVTMGRTAQAGHVIRPEGIDVVEVERGGDVTYHGPGQLVGYPILDLTGFRQDLHWYLRTLEAALIQALANLGIVAVRRAGFTGVWTGGRKIASIGVHVKQWVTWHGFALNVSTDLQAFDRIVPCGIAGVEMTSIERERGAGSGERSAAGLWEATMSAVIGGFERAFAVKARELAAVPLYAIS